MGRTIFTLFFFAEILFFIWIVSLFGWGYVLLAYLAPTFLGFIFMGLQSRSALMSLQMRLQQGQDPGFQLLNAAAVFIGCVCFLPPFVTPRVLGLFLLIPGVRHLVVWAFQVWVLRRLGAGGFAPFVFKAGNFGGGFTFSTGAGFPPGHQPRRHERDADVIDVTPLPEKKLEIDKKD